MPNRIIKESICTSDSISQCSWFEEVLFYRLIVNCDDYGRFDGRTAVIKSRLFPLADGLTAKNVEEAIKKLVSIGLVCSYEAQGKPFLYLPTWNEHQSIRAKKSKYPSPDDGINTSESICKQMISDESKCPRNPIQSESNPIRNPNQESYSMRTTAVADYLNRINPSASPVSIDELKAYEQEMGSDVCIRAFDIALDNKSAKWSYIKAILSKWQSLGVKCLADIEEKDRKPETSAPKKSQKNGPGAFGFDEASRNARMQKDMEWLKQFSESEHG